MLRNRSQCIWTLVDYARASFFCTTILLFIYQNSNMRSRISAQYSTEHWFIHQHTPSHPHKPCACHKRISSYDEHWNGFTWDWLHYRHPCARIYSSIHSIKWWDISTMPAKININTTHKDEANNAWFAMHRGLSAHPSMLELIILHFFCVFA